MEHGGDKINYIEFFSKIVRYIFLLLYLVSDN